jgi:hypothetical protein
VWPSCIWDARLLKVKEGTVNVSHTEVVSVTNGGQTVASLCGVGPALTFWHRNLAFKF